MLDCVGNCSGNADIPKVRYIDPLAKEDELRRVLDTTLATQVQLPTKHFDGSELPAQPVDALLQHQMSRSHRASGRKGSGLIPGSSPRSYSSPLRSDSSSFASRLYGGAQDVGDGCNAVGGVHASSTLGIAATSLKCSAFSNGNGVDHANSNGDGNGNGNGGGGSCKNAGMNGTSANGSLSVSTGMPSVSSKPLHVTVEGGSPRGASPRSMDETVVQPTAQPLLPTQALPVQFPAKITHNYTPALKVMEAAASESPEEFKEKVAEVLKTYQMKLTERTRHHMGYPYNLDFDYGALEGLEKFSINNLGDPFIESNYGVHSREFEIGVLNWFAKLWEIDQEEYWGYVTNCGTEGNLHGVLVGRENLPDGILYTSKETHYSVMKAARMYRMDAIEVSTLASGEIDYEELEEQLAAHVERPAIINVNIGTTVRGAVDDLDRVLTILERTGYSEDRFFIHCDGALFGLMIPFVKSAPMVTFKKAIGSVSVSGHKFVGAPVPCGVVITRKRYVMALSSEVEYLNSRDATIMGSRNGHAPIYLWYTLTLKGYDGMRADVEKCLHNAHLLKAMLENSGIKCMLNSLSSTVVFERPTDLAFVRKWQLACEGDIAHVVVMPNIGIDMLEEFMSDLINSRSKMSVAAVRQLASDARELQPDH